MRTTRRLGVGSVVALALNLTLGGPPPAPAAAADADGSDPAPDDDPWGRIATLLALDDLIDLAEDDAGAAADALVAAGTLPRPIARTFLDGLLRAEEWEGWWEPAGEPAPGPDWP